MPRKTEDKLKVIERKGSPALYIRGTIRGHSIFESAGTSDSSLAEAFRRKRESELWRAALEFDGNAPPKRKEPTFAEAVVAYCLETPPSRTTAIYLKRLMDLFGRRPLSEINHATLSEAYKPENGILSHGAGPATRIRSVITPMRAVLTHAAFLEWCPLPNFKLPLIPSSRTPHMLPEVATALVRASAPHLRPLVVFLIGTGCRLSEALELEWRFIDPNRGRAIVFQKDRTGTPKERIVDLPPIVSDALEALPHRSGTVFRPERKGRSVPAEGYRNNGRIAGGQIKSGWNAACGRAGLAGKWVSVGRPDRKSRARRFAPELTPHSCRHTYASWHYCLHKDILRLRDDGGWSSTKMCERYAKRVADDQREAILDWLEGRVDLGVKVIKSEQAA
jgi:integrase